MLNFAKQINTYLQLATIFLLTTIKQLNYENNSRTLKKSKR
jgi:hypothetical protein